MTNLERAKDLYERVAQGQLLEAFEKYYAEDVEMVEPRGNRKGKEACRASEVQFLESLEGFHGMEVKAITEDTKTGKVLIEVAMDMTFKGGTRNVMEQVSSQTWKNGQVIHERFYYNQ